jgi:hypothetical protein
MLKIIFSLILALSIGISTTHHHEDGRVHLDCPVCIFQINDHSENPDISILLPEIEYFPVAPPRKESKISFEKTRYYNQRAPPFYSHL